MKAPTKRSTAGRKPVQYRARHKNLGDLKEEDTKHGFEHRVKVERPKSHISEPVYCSVWGGDQPVDSIELNSLNYRSAPTRLEDHLRVRRPRTRRTSTTPISDSSSSAPPFPDVQISGYLGQEFLTSPTTNEYDTFPTTPDDLRSPESFYPIVSGGYPEPLTAKFNFHRPITHNQNYAAFNAAMYGGRGSYTDNPQLNQQGNNQVWGYGPGANPRSYQSGSRQFQNLSATNHCTPSGGGTGLWTNQRILPSPGDHCHENYLWDFNMPASDDYYIYGSTSAALPSLPYTAPQLVHPHPYPSIADYYSLTQTDETLPPHSVYNNYGPVYNGP